MSRPESRPAPVLTLTVSGDRPGYLAETLASWSRVRGLDRWRREFLVEPGSRVAECRAVIAEWAPDATVTVHPERLGVLANPHAALTRAFAGGAGFVVLAEEDIVVSDDVLEFVTDRADALAGDPSVLALCAFSGLPAPQRADAVGAGPFTAWVWGTWADRWHETLEREWFTAARCPDPGAGQGFDFGIARLAVASGRGFVVPLASRSDNIGEHGGVHALPEDFAATRAATFADHRDPVTFTDAATVEG